MSSPMKSPSDRDPRVGLLLAVVGIALAWMGVAGWSDSAGTDDPTAKSPATGRPPAAVTRMSPDAPVSSIPLRADTPSVPASKPTDRSETTKVMVDLACAVEVHAPHVRGKFQLVSWPASGRGELSQWVDIHDGTLAMAWQLPAKKTDGEALRHEARLLVQGYAPTDVSFLTLGQGPSGICLPSPIVLEPTGTAVTGTVRLADGSPAERAIVEGCGARARAAEDGSYVLVPFELPCEVFARHAPGSGDRTPAKAVDGEGGRDILVDFTVERPPELDPGVAFERTEDGGVTITRATFEVAQWKELHLGTRLLAFGDVAVQDMTDEEIVEAMVFLDEPIQVRHVFQTVEGEEMSTDAVIEVLADN